MIQTLETYELRDGHWWLFSTLKGDEPVCIPQFDTIEFSLADLWA